MILPSYPFNSMSLLPISPQAVILNKILAGHQVISYNWVIYLYAQSLIYLFMGVVLFKEAENYAKVKGILGQY